MPVSSQLRSLMLLAALIFSSVAPALAGQLPDYDSEVVVIRQDIGRGDMAAAGRHVERLLEAFPDNPELLAIQARLHFWAGRHDKALAIYRRLLTTHPSPELRAEVAKVELAREQAAADAKPSAPVLQTDEYLAHRNSLSLKVEHSQNSNGFPPGTDTTLELTQKVGGWTAAPRLMVSRRYGITNSEVGLDLYPPPYTPGKLWGYVSATASPEADYLPRWSAGGALFKGTGWGEVSCGYRHQEFSDAPVEIVFVGHSIVLPPAITVENRLYAAFNEGKVAFSGAPALIWDITPRAKAYLRLSLGEEVEKIGPDASLQKLLHLEQRTGGEFRVTPRFGIAAEFFWIARERLYDSTGFSVGVRSWW
jgi:YaiO family outer membrane protein